MKDLVAEKRRFEKRKAKLESRWAFHDKLQMGGHVRAAKAIESKKANGNYGKNQHSKKEPT